MSFNLTNNGYNYDNNTKSLKRYQSINEIKYENFKNKFVREQQRHKTMSNANSLYNNYDNKSDFSWSKPESKKKIPKIPESDMEIKKRKLESSYSIWEILGCVQR